MATARVYPASQKLPTRADTANALSLEYDLQMVERVKKSILKDDWNVG